MARKLALLAFSAVGVVAAAGWTAASDAAVPNTLTEQGRLLDSNGNPVTAPVQFTFTVYDQATLGTALWTESQMITLDNGYFSARLGDKTALPANLFDGTVRYLGIKISTDAEMSPRQPIVSVPYALHAAEADHAAAATTAMTAANATNATNATNAGKCDRTDRLIPPESPHAFYETWGSDGVLRFWVDVTNVVSLASTGAATKNFIIAHPTDAGRYLVHTTLEGPENAVFYRGTARLHRGVAEISLPGYFEAATRQDGRTVLVTPKFDTMEEPVSALAASAVRRGAFVVRSLDKRNPDQAFDWEVKAVRADVAELTAEPRRSDIVVHGSAPYTYFSPK